MSAILVAISGGHLAQLELLAPRISGAEERVWVTDRTEQSLSLLADEDVHYVATRSPRDLFGVIADGFRLSKAFRDAKPDLVVSTGSQIAFSALIQAYFRRIPFVYVESATRVRGLSLTGRVMGKLPRVRRFVQYPFASDSRWKYALSVFEGFEVDRREALTPEADDLDVVVSLGGNDEYGFRRLMDGLVGVIPPTWTVFWQVGPTNMDGLDIDFVRRVSSDELSSRMRDADVVICHSGTGSILAALMAGKMPIVVPRRPERGEHVDDHQQDLAALAGERGLALVREADEISMDDILSARGFAARRSQNLGTVDLLGSPRSF